MSAITLTQFRNALYTLLTDQQAATPALLRKVFRARPGAIGEAPVAWLDAFDDDLGYDMGTRNRTITNQITVGAPYVADITTSADPFDELRDALIERFTANSAAIPSTVLECTHVSGGDLTIQKADGASNTYRGMTFDMRLRIWEGRD